MPEIKGVSTFQHPGDAIRSTGATKFYTEIVGCKFLSQRPDKVITCLDAGGVCLLLINARPRIIKGQLDMSDGVHHAFMVDAAEYQAAVERLARQGRRRLLRGRPARRHDRRAARVLSRS